MPAQLSAAAAIAEECSVDRSLDLGQYRLSRLADAQQEQPAAKRVNRRPVCAVES